MALATQCPHCGKRFRVAADQLKLRGGIVRCGACQEIFDGNATLIDLDAQATSVPASAPDETPETVVPAHGSAPPRGTHAEPADTRRALEPAATVIDAPPEEPEPAQDSAAFAPKDSTLDAEEPIYTLDFDHTFDAFGILPKSEGAEEHEPEPEAQTGPDTSDAADAPGPAAEPEPPVEPVAHDAPPAPAPVEEPVSENAAAEARRIEPTLGLPVDEELVAAPLPGHDLDLDEATQPPSPPPAARATQVPPPLLMRESAPVDAHAAPAQPRPPLRPKAAETRAARRSKLTPTKIAAPKLRVPEIDEPEFVKRSRQQEQSGKTRRILMAVGSAVLLLALATQGAIIFRNELAARYPAAKGALAATCAVFGCRVELPARIDNLTIEQGELTALGGNAYSLATLLHNQGNLAQAWPSIELTLNDANDKPLLRRVFVPAEYLAQGVTPAAGFAARAEQPVKLYFQLDQLKPSGYRIAVFYP
jgi:predicted Zn finger-like uncharacterized protein